MPGAAGDAGLQVGGVAVGPVAAPAARSPRALRMAVTLPVTAQSPKATTSRLRARMIADGRQVVLVGARPPRPASRRRPRGTPSRRRWASRPGRSRPARSSSRSSRSRNDMWQPEQPPSQAVATRGRTRRRCGHLLHGFFSRASDVGEELAVLRASPARPRLLEERAGRADLDALAAAGAGLARRPRAGARSVMTRASAPAAGHVPGVRPLDLVADPDAARAEDAAPVVDARSAGGEASSAVAGWTVGVADVVHADRVGHVLELAVAVGDADGADVVALGEEQLDDLPPVALEPLGGGGDLHPLLGAQRAGGLEPGRALHLDEAEPAGADRRRAPRGGRGWGAGCRARGRARGWSRPGGPRPACPSMLSVLTVMAAPPPARAPPAARSCGRRRPGSAAPARGPGTRRGTSAASR